ncbi:hypothetical protein [Luteipulveratus flavus]|uniref:Rhamnogalacturonan lyase domain-containing protein n=1 Tax=Luteipulveratus flavus TaxID=3031728 RepID=A0ABT6C7E1_9MICO|nr:hypothetical protein [Luteipulveratus sp. YIM 133296]MDF8264773.1 hypothetical protein [Luteipulveratus sp. YIM 133296]
MALAPSNRVAGTGSRLEARASGDLRRISVTWDPSHHPDVVGYRVHGQHVRRSSAARLRPRAENLLAELQPPMFAQHGLSAQGESWEYAVVAVDVHGAALSTSDPVTATSTTSVTVTGTPVATVGRFDGRGRELALSPGGFVRYQSVFPADVDFTHGRDRADVAWSYLQPGPDDAWAGRRSHRFRLRFRLDTPPVDDLDLAVWLTDRHPVRAGAAGLAVNGVRLEPLIFADEGDASFLSERGAPGHGAGPAYLERPLRRSLFRAGENVLEIAKDQGSWIAYDALGVFART